MFTRILASLVANGLGLYLAVRYVPGVEIPLEIIQFGSAVILLSLINLFIRPFIKFVLTPVIILTLGLGVVLVNATTLYVLEFLYPAVSIDGFRALLFASLILTGVNLVIHFSAKRLKKDK